MSCANYPIALPCLAEITLSKNGTHFISVLFYVSPLTSSFLKCTSSQDSNDSFGCFLRAEWKSPTLECPRVVSKACMLGGNAVAVAAVNDYIHGNTSGVHGSSQFRHTCLVGIPEGDSVITLPDYVFSLPLPGAGWREYSQSSMLLCSLR